MKLILNNKMKTILEVICIIISYFVFSMGASYIIGLKIFGGMNFCPTVTTYIMKYFIVFLAVAMTIILVKIKISSKVFLAVNLAVTLSSIILCYASIIYFREGIPFVNMIIAPAIFFTINTVIYFTDKYLKNKGLIVLITLLAAFAIFDTYSFKPIINSDNEFYSLEMKVLENRQYIFRYKNDFYYATRLQNGIFKMTPEGQTQNIYDAKFSWDPMFLDPSFFMEDNLCYFKENNIWNTYDVETKQVKDNIALTQQQMDFVSNYNSYEPEFAEKLIDKKYIFIYHTKIIGDGYLYYNEGEGNLCRYNAKTNKVEVLVSGQVTIFSIDNNIITYYDIKENMDGGRKHILSKFNLATRQKEN